MLINVKMNCKPQRAIAAIVAHDAFDTIVAMSYTDRKQRLSKELLQSHGTIRLRKETSNLFRVRDRAKTLLDGRDFNHVIEVNSSAGWVDVEGMTTYEHLVNECLKYGVMPAVVPQLKSITIGGAVVGLGIEASSFRYGLVHETVLEVDVLLFDGRIVTCTRDNEFSDLFFGIPNSFGTLGYVLRVRALVVPIKPYVHIRHIRFTDSQVFLSALQKNSHEKNVHFLEGEFFSDNEQYITTGTFSDTADYTSDYTYMNIYYHSIRSRTDDFLTIHDFIWRWDTDWFWDSKIFLAEYPLVRRILGKKRLNSAFYTKLMRFHQRWHIGELRNRIMRRYGENVIQDIPIPAEQAHAFLDFFKKEIGITPVWIVPINAYDVGQFFPLFPMDPNKLYFNFGFWHPVHSHVQHQKGYFNRRIEQVASELGGIKSLYSDSYYSEEEFWRIYGKDAYRALKQKYDPQGRFKNLYDKCVRKA